MYKYEMDPVSIIKKTEQTRFCPQTDGRMDGRTDRQGETSIPPFSFVEARGIITGTRTTGTRKHI